MTKFIHFLADRGCHGALLLGTTGEGPSFSSEERQVVLRSAIRIKEEFPDFGIIAGTGTPSLTETITLTKMAFQEGADAALVLPPYYFKNTPEEGLFRWYSRIIEEAVPEGKFLLAYNIPAISQIPITSQLLALLKHHYPRRMAGLKDSTGDPNLAREFGDTFGEDMFVFTGNDRLFGMALDHGAAGCITAPANIISPLLHQLWESNLAGAQNPTILAQIERGRNILDQFPPAPAILKGILHRHFGFSSWQVRPPLLPADHADVDSAIRELEAAGIL